MSDITPDPLTAPVAPRGPDTAATTPAGATKLPPELNPRGYTKPKRRRTPRVLAWVAVLTSTLVLLGSGALYAGYRKLDGNIHRVKIAALNPIGASGGGGGVVVGGGGTGKGAAAPRPVKAKGAEKDINYLIIGSDSRAGASPAELKAFGTQFEAGQRSDTMLLVNIPANREGAYVLSFPRDLYVEIPGLDGKHKINAAFSKGGPDLAIRTVELLTQIHIDHYLGINFTSFLRMVDALDGVELCVPKAMRSRDAALDLKAGKQKLNGSTALSYVRARTFDKDSEYKDPTADVGRIARQQQFLGAMIRRATSSSTLLRPDRLARFLNQATSAIEADEGLKTSDLKNLALRFRNLDPKRVVFATVPNFDPGRRYGGQSVLLVEDDAAEQIFGAIRQGSMTEDGSPPPIPSVAPGQKLVVDPANIRVRVLNGTNINGKAGEVRTDLESRKFDVTETATANAADRGATDTVVRYGAKSKDAADTVAASIPGSHLELDENLGRTVTVIVGSNYAGTKAVKISIPRPSGSPPVKVATTTAADDAVCG